ncbi:hypothetical protein E2C01_058971 [Portunus trituberculatus]|uniref:Uncharacterized protein n=1 Tax=Portunus trituberculatus TaxID=210409 RepID=A0A5B7H4U7_PORTR|nr:hypothetical protein [Portunus trituberculatus]
MQFPASSGTPIDPTRPHPPSPGKCGGGASLPSSSTARCGEAVLLCSRRHVAPPSLGCGCVLALSPELIISR